MTTDADDVVEFGLRSGVTLDAIIAAARARQDVASGRQGGSQADGKNGTKASPTLASNQGASSKTSRVVSTFPDLSQPAEDRPRIEGLPRYDDLGPLGSGGMGDVRRVHDRRLGRTLALKILHAPALERPGIVARFLEEAQATAQLQHPNIIPVYDSGKLSDGRLWFTMQEVSGRTLGEVIREVHAVSGERWEVASSGWSLRRLIDALRQVCQGVGYAHSRGVVHRDLKPSNVMVGPHSEVLVLDWGLAKVMGSPSAPSEAALPAPVQTKRSETLSHQTMAGAVAGTPAYMPPEQAHGQVDQITARTDVYALGAMLYEILAGRAPYEGDDALAVLSQVWNGPPAPLQPAAQPMSTPVLDIELTTESVPTAPPLPPVLVTICEQAMARSPQERFVSAEALATALGDWLDGAQRRDDALTVVQQASGKVPEAHALRAQAARLRSEASALLTGIEAWRPEEDKALGWAKEDEAAALEKKAELAELEEELLLHGSLTHEPDLPEAHAALAARYRAEHAAAEMARSGAIRAEVLFRQHLAALPLSHPDRPDHINYLQGHGALTLLSDPPGAEVLLHRYERHNRRQVPRFERSLGRTPLHGVSLPMGSYLCVLRHPERVDVPYPVWIERQQHWDGVPPEGGDPVTIRLPLPSELGPKECYVPAGWFWSGGDTQVESSLPPRRLWVDAHVFQRFSVTNDLYLQFLNDLVAQGRSEEAIQHAPRERAGTAGEQGALICGFDGQHWYLRPDADGDIWEPDYPITMVDWHGARAFAAWMAERSGLPWQLPNELAWEKAARGVDSRRFPWGDAFDPSWACMRDSHAGRLLPAVVDSFPVDESPFGLRGTAGNGADWCADTFQSKGPDVVNGRVQSQPGTEPTTSETYRVVRGGGWFNASSELGAAHRRYLDASYRGFDLSFRLARPAP